MLISDRRGGRLTLLFKKFEKTLDSLISTVGKCINYQVYVIWQWWEVAGSELFIRG